MTPIRETIARAIDGAAFDDEGMLMVNRLLAYPPGYLPRTEEDLLSQQRQSRDDAMGVAGRVLRALDEAGLVVVRKDAVTAPDERELR